MTPQDQAFADFKNRALERDLLVEAKARGAKLRRAGREWIGPCPNCAGTDRFSINPAKGVFNCRGAEGGNVISMVMHLDGVTFVQACEALTGETNPSGAPAKPLSDGERAARDKTRQANEARQRLREAEEAKYQEDTKEAAQAIWNGSHPVLGTLGETYLRNRRLENGEWPSTLRFHPSLPYPGHGRMPALVCRVDDLAGSLCAVWRIFLDENGRKADVDNPKLGLGPAGGGAVRIGGMGSKIGIAEGLESAIGAWNLTGRKYPVWASLSTSGLIAIELPLGVQHVVLFPDGDAAMRKKDGEYIPAVPAGRKAALSLRTRLLAEGINVTLAAEPGCGTDYCDLWSALTREMA